MNERRYFHWFYLMQAAALLCVLVPFIRWNNLQEWDFPGHYAAIWYLKTRLLPWASGWNPYFYCGYPQGISYPPLAHYIAALLSMVMGIGPAVKGLVVVSVLLLPIAFYAFSRRWGLSDLQAAVCCTWMTMVLFLSGEALGTLPLGSDLSSTLNVGLFANALSLPILFAFLATFGKPGRSGWKWPALWLGLLFLIHPLSSLIAGIFVLTLGSYRLWKPDERPGWSSMLVTGAIALLMGSCWLLPFISQRSLMNPELVRARWSTAVELIILIGAAIVLAGFAKPQLRPLALTYLVLANFIAMGTLWGLNLEFSRLTIYAFFILPVFLVVWVRSKPALFAMALLGIGLGFFAYRNSGLHPEGVPDFPLPNFGPVNGRILSVVPFWHLPSAHVQHELIPLRTGNESILGLFIESGLNGRIVADLMLTIDKDAFVWGTTAEAPDRRSLGEDYSTYVFERLHLFDIRYIYTDLKLEATLDPSLAQTKRYINSYPEPDVNAQVQLEQMRRQYNSHDGQLDFYLYPVGASARAQPLPYIPSVPATEWKQTSVKWFIQKRGLPIFTDHEIPAGVRPATPEDKVDVFEDSPRKDRLILHIQADQDIPVLVKVRYFPNWKLTVNGKPAPVYRASPDLMLIFAHGPAVLEYRRSWTEYVGLLLSLAGVILWIVL